MASFPPYSGSPSYYSAPGAGRFNTDPGANRQNTFSTGVGAPYTNPAWSTPNSSMSLPNNAESHRNAPADKTEDKRSLKTTLLKCGLEIVVGLAAFPFGAQLGERYLLKQCGDWANKVGGFGLSFILSALTGGIFSCIYQKVKNGTINTKTLLNDTLWGGFGG